MLFINMNILLLWEWPLNLFTWFFIVIFSFVLCEDKEMYAIGKFESVEHLWNLVYEDILWGHIDELLLRY